MLALRADDAKCRPCQLYFPADVIAAQSYLAYTFDRLVTDWNRHVSIELSKCETDDERTQRLAQLLHLNELNQPDTQHPAPSTQHSGSGWASKRKKPNPLTDEEVSKRWQAQIDAFDSDPSVSGLISYH